MKLVYLLIPVFYCACTVEELPVDPEAQTTGVLDTRIHTEPDQTWDEALTAHDISWRFLSASPLRNSISVVGSFQITFANTHTERAWQSQVAIRFRGADGALHIPETPLSRLSIAADSTVAIRENFILEVADAQTANAIARMNIVIF